VDSHLFPKKQYTLKKVIAIYFAEFILPNSDFVLGVGKLTYLGRGKSLSYGITTERDKMGDIGGG